MQFCYDPINSVINAAMNDDRDKLLPMLEKLGVKSKMKQDDFLLSGKPLMKRVMQTWMPAHEALLEMMVFHLPSPGTAQRYRVENLYEGPMDDKYAESMRQCNADGPLMMYVSKVRRIGGSSPGPAQPPALGETCMEESCRVPLAAPAGACRARCAHCQ